MRQRHDGDDHRIYKTFEEFEREELRRMETAGSSVDEMVDSIFEEEVAFDGDRHARHASVWSDDDEE